MSTNIKKTDWQVCFTKKAVKQANKLPMPIHDSLYLLKRELEIEGPVQSEWFHYGKLVNRKKSVYHHCHLNKGHPRYVAVWEVEDDKAKIIEICFTGTHEKVDYKKFK